MKMLGLLLGVLLGFASTSHAGELRLGTTDFCHWEFSGEIVKGDAAKIDKIPRGSFGRRLCLNSPGGSLSEGLAIFDLIWDSNISTTVMPGDRCESACAIAFLGGSLLEGTDVTRQMDRIMWVGSKLGFHGPSLNLKTGQAYADRDLNRAFKTAISAAARLFEVNRVQDRGDRAMTDHLLHRWLNTDPSNMYFVDTVGDAILSDIPVGGVYFDIKLRTDHIKNVCDNVYLKGSYPSGSGLSGTIHSSFTTSAELLTSYQDDPWREETQVLAEVVDGTLRAFAGPYPSGTKYFMNGCLVEFDVNSVREFLAEDYYYQKVPISVGIVHYTSPPESMAMLDAWTQERDVLQHRSLDPIYLFSFDTMLDQLPKSDEQRRAVQRPARTDKDEEGWEYYKLISYYRRDLPGGDIGSLKTEDVNDCAIQCLGNEGCIGLTMDRWNNICFLKGQDAVGSALRLHPKAETYLKVGVAFDMIEDSRPAIMKHRKGKGFEGYAYETFDASTYEVCAALCLADQSCMAVNFRPAQKSCEKLADPPEYFSMDGVEMGLKLQVD